MRIVVPGRKTFHTRQPRSAGILPAPRKTPMPRPSEQKEFKQGAGRRDEPVAEFRNQSRSADKN